MKVCRKCGASDFYTGKSKGCRPCNIERSRELRKLNKVRYAKRRREYYLENKERITEAHKAWVRNNPQRTELKNRRAAERRRNAPGGPFDPSRRDYKQRLLETGEDCFYCGMPGEVWDHSVPLAKGGSNAPENLCRSCRKCNASKRDKTQEEWAAWLSVVVPDHPFLQKLNS